MGLHHALLCGLDGPEDEGGNNVVSEEIVVWDGGGELARAA